MTGAAPSAICEPSVIVVGRLQLHGSREHTHEPCGVMDQKGEMLRANPEVKQVAQNIDYRVAFEFIRCEELKKMGGTCWLANGKMDITEEKGFFNISHRLNLIYRCLHI